MGGVEISLESINNNEKGTTATNTTEINKDMCDNQNNIVIDRRKNVANQLYHNLSNNIRKRNDSQFNACTKMQVVTKIRKTTRKNFTTS